VLEWKKLLFGHAMALELLQQVYALCRDQDASVKQAFPEAHSANIDLLYLYEGEKRRRRCNS
jgi:hypothetical protein